MGSILGIVIFEQQPIEQELSRFWRNWKYREDDEVDATEKRLPFLGGEFPDNTILRISQIRQDEYHHIGFVITPSQALYYYYDYETTDPSYYYQLIINDNYISSHPSKRY
jgi:hypothetical protein